MWSQVGETYILNKLNLKYFIQRTSLKKSSYQTNKRKSSDDIKHKWARKWFKSLYYFWQYKLKNPRFWGNEMRDAEGSWYFIDPFSRIAHNLFLTSLWYSLWGSSATWRLFCKKLLILNVSSTSISDLTAQHLWKYNTLCSTVNRGMFVGELNSQ